jgi:hypothetical protein
MKNALIAPMQAPVQYTSGWTTDTLPKPIYTEIANSCRVAQVEIETFEVALPLFWTECSDDVIADQWYYNTSDNKIYPVPESPPAPEGQIPNS